MSNVLTEKIYPETELKCVELANTVKLLLGTWVRDLAIFTKEFQDSFIKRCLLCKYYWQVPKSIHKPPYVNIDGIPVVKKDNNHLSDKEEFMTKYRVL